MSDADSRPELQTRANAAQDDPAASSDVPPAALHPAGGTQEEPKRRRRSLAGGVSTVFALALIITSALAAWASTLDLPAWLIFLICCGAGLTVGTWLLNRHLRPITEVVQALGDGISSLKDNDFSIRLAVTRRDELGEVVALYNQAVGILREERSAIRQRELLLETAL